MSLGFTRLGICIRPAKPGLIAQPTIKVPNKSEVEVLPTKPSKGVK